MTFKLYAQGVVGSQNGIKSLNDSWKSPEIQGVFEYVKRSLDANPNLAESATIPSRGWVQAEQGQRQSKKQDDQSENPEASDVLITDDEISQVILDFQKTYPDIKLNSQNDNHSISVRPTLCVCRLYD